MGKSFADIGKVQAIEELYRLSAYKRDDGFSFNPERGSTVSTVSRLYVEGVDFNLVYFPLKHLGYKCIVGATGPIYAALAHPKLLSVTIGVSSKLDFEEITQLWTGIAVAAKEHGYKAVDLDLKPSPNGLYISLAASGESLQLTQKRLPALKSKDLVCVSGPLGAAYLGMQVLEKGRRDFEKTSQQPDMKAYRMLVAAYLRPELDSGIVSRIEDAEIYPAYAAFVNEGLGDCLKRLQRDSGLGVKVYADKLPFEGNSFQAGKEMDIDPVSAAFGGGDDNVVLLVIPALSYEKFHREFPTFSVIGHMAKPEAGAVLVTPEGVEFPVKAQGWKEE